MAHLSNTDLMELARHAKSLGSTLKGGAGSGNHGHKGIPGHRGGSGSSKISSGSMISEGNQSISSTTQEQADTDVWSKEGKQASPAAVIKILEATDLPIATSFNASYNHRGQMTGGGGGYNKGIVVRKATLETRLTYSFGRSMNVPSDIEREKAQNYLNQARVALKEKGFQTRPLMGSNMTYEIEKVPKG